MVRKKTKQACEPTAGGETRHPVVIYARVSSKDQEREGFSIPAQLEMLHQYSADCGFSVLREFIDVETAKRAGRVARFVKATGTRSVPR